MQQFRKISAILLSMLVLLSSTSFSLGMHFCMGELESISLFGGTDSCCMAQQKSPCSSDQNGEHQQDSKKGCCEDQTLVKKGQDDLTQVSKISIPALPLIAVVSQVLSFICSNSTIDYYTNNDYSPPLIKRDIPLFVQSFLI